MRYGVDRKQALDLPYFEWVPREGHIPGLQPHSGRRAISEVGMLGAPSRWMHHITFCIKRCHLQTLKFHHRIIRRFGLTPARFDMMYAIRETGQGLEQMALRRELGVSRPTVSRMVRSLEQLGLVRRRRSSGDRRTWVLWLSDEGIACMRKAMREVFGTSTIEWTIGNALTKTWWSEDARFHAMASLSERLESYREGYWDTARLVYPWHPDD